MRGSLRSPERIRARFVSACSELSGLFSRIQRGLRISMLAGVCEYVSYELLTYLSGYQNEITTNKSPIGIWIRLETLQATL